MSGNTARNKGKRGEYQVRDLLQGVLNSVYDEVGVGPEGRAVVGRNLGQSRDGGHDLDVFDWISVEVKYQESFNLPKWWEQCIMQSKRNGGIPVLIYRGNGRAWRAQMLSILETENSSVRVLSDISIDHFLFWFRLMVLEKVAAAHGAGEPTPVVTENPKN